MNSIVLKACPFCGGEADMVAKLPSFGGEITYAVICEDCGATSGYKLSEGEAQAAWNRRLSNAD